MVGLGRMREGEYVEEEEEEEGNHCCLAKKKINIIRLFKSFVLRENIWLKAWLVVAIFLEKW